MKHAGHRGAHVDRGGSCCDRCGSCPCTRDVPTADRLVECFQAAEHVPHVRDAGDAPYFDRLLEGSAAAKHVAHVRDAGNVPSADRSKHKMLLDKTGQLLEHVSGRGNTPSFDNEFMLRSAGGPLIHTKAGNASNACQRHKKNSVEDILRHGVPQQRSSIAVICWPAYRSTSYALETGTRRDSESLSVRYAPIPVPPRTCETRRVLARLSAPAL